MDTTASPKYRKKLIEVDLPLDEINDRSASEPTTRSGHPWRLQVWWARRRQVACRAVLFASLVDDPGDCPEEFPNEDAQRSERRRLHDLIKRLVVWDHSENASLLAEARWEIARSVARSRGEPAPDPTKPDAVLRYLAEKALPIHDPFCGGGSIPLEAQRLGMRALASDLNPVAVLITKALIELPPKFANRPPVNPDANPLGVALDRDEKGECVSWRGAAGLADDIRYYGRKMREMAWGRIGHLYPKAKLATGGEATVIAWLWTRTIPCPNPACGVSMPLSPTFQISTRKGNEQWTRPIFDHDSKRVSFVVQSHDGLIQSDGARRGDGFVCVACEGPVEQEYVREQARAQRISEVMSAIVAEGKGRRLFLSPTGTHIKAASAATPEWHPVGTLPEEALGFRVQRYGFSEWQQFFTRRQLIAHTTFSDLLIEIHSEIPRFNGSEYADAVCTYLALAIGKMIDGNCRFTRWQYAGSVAAFFSSPRISMLWDFAETNPFSNSTKNWSDQVELVAKAVEHLPTDTKGAIVCQADAATTADADKGIVIVTDPPYYANIGYADLSDFFYVWLRPVLRDIYPDLFAGILTPKDDEIVAAPRFDATNSRFESKLEKALTVIRNRCSPEFPSSIFYAYKQQEEERDGQVSTGWETMLSALVTAGFQIVGTWPIRTERSNRLRSHGSNSLASSVVLVCRPRLEDAPTTTRRQFLNALESELPKALDHLTREGHIAPVDLAQAAIGPGMQIYSRYRRVETIGGEPVPVREALTAINRVIAEYDERQQGDLDSQTRFCLDWLRQNGYNEGRYGEAEDLARAKNVSVEELRDGSSLLTATAGRVKLLPLDEYGPEQGIRLGDMTAWEGCFRMAYHLSREDGRGTEGAAAVVQAMGSSAESVERLARILYNHYDRRGDSRNSVMFNNLVIEWPNILARVRAPEQRRLI